MGPSRIAIDNATAFPTAEIGELVHFVFDGRPLPRRVAVRYYRKRDGEIIGQSKEATRLVRIAFPLVHYPETFEYRELGTPAWTVYDWREHLVAMLAHEAKHIEDFGASERAAELHAIAELRRYRIEHPLRFLVTWARTWSW